MLGSQHFFLTFFEGPAPFVPANASSRGTMSIRKSNWSDLLSAFAISALDNVLRLLESATMKARAVISEINTKVERIRK